MSEKNESIMQEEIERLKGELALLGEKFENEKAEKETLRSVSQACGLVDVLELLSDGFDSMSEVEGYLINLLDDEEENLVCEKIVLPAKFIGIEKTYYKYKYALNKHDANIEVYKNKASLKITSENAAQYGSNTETRFTRWELAFLAVLPVMDGDDVIGTLMVMNQSEEIKDETLKYLGEYVNSFAVQIRNAQHFTELERLKKAFETAKREQQLFLQFISKVNSLTSVESIYEMFTEELLRRYSFNLSGIVMKEGGELVSKKNTIIDSQFQDIYDEWIEYYTENSYQIDLNDGATAASFIQNSHIIIRDVLEILHLPMSIKDKKALEIMRTPRTFLFVPIVQQNKPVGVLWLFSIKETVNITDEDLAIINLLCSFLGTSISNAELYTRVDDQNKEIETLNSNLEQKVLELHELATKDRLTGLYNFGYFQEELQRRINEYKRCKGERFFSMIIIDIDHFKRFNDNYGHLGGNIALKDVASRISQQAREMDLVCRYGGEEFVVVLPKCDLEGARNFAERVRECVAERPVKTDANDVPVTISIGCSSYIPEETASSLIGRADEALYRAKENGRNRVEIAFDELPVESK